MIFHRMKSSQMTSVRDLLRLLSALRIIGTLNVRTERIPLTEFGKPAVYSLHYIGYDEASNSQVILEDAIKISDIYNE